MAIYITVKIALKHTKLMINLYKITACTCCKIL